jgi:cell wall-associated NlpC family hydrolase
MLRCFRIIAGFTLLALVSTTSLGEEESLGEKIKGLFTTPTPAPAHRHHHKKSTPTPTPSPGKEKAKKKSTPTPTPTASPTETPTPTPEESASPTATPRARVASLSPDEIKDFDKNPAPVRKLLESALALTKRSLDYSYGSAEPENGGMDCSGFIYYVLRENGIEDVPRSASEQYVWVRKAGAFRAVLSQNADSFELDELEPGDLLFWTGTYNAQHDPPVTHTMIYLGKQKSTGKPVMVGSSDGRTYEGEQQFGVSVFDFNTTPSKSAANSGKYPRFVGYARIPGLSESWPNEQAKPQEKKKSTPPESR